MWIASSAPRFRRKLIPNPGSNAVPMRCKPQVMLYPQTIGCLRRIERPRGAMSALTKTLRVKAAIVLAALYTLCILAPTVAFALSENPAMAHCLTEGHVGVHDHGANPEYGGKLHVHADGTAHQHHDDGAPPQPSRDDGKAAIAACCGLFSVVAIPGEPIPSFGLHSLAAVVLSVLTEAPSGRGPERINRPPIV